MKKKLIMQVESKRDGKNWSLPFTKERVDSFIADKPQFYNSSVFTAEFNNNLEVCDSLLRDFSNHLT
jgi:hypothetical protein